MQVLRLVESGWVDKIIAFDELPKRFFLNVGKKALDGFPRYWLAWLKDHDSVRDLERYNPVTAMREKYIEPFTYIMDYKDVNQDKERWQEISSYVRRAVDVSFRLRDKLEDMAAPLAVDSYKELSLDPEDIPIIPIPVETVEPEPEVQMVLEEPKRRRGRPKKEKELVS